ncbi:hypothetical protein F4553_002548 [Allocatelliglobosispora scoriae]|uniref:2'-5' RNA ligase family protein n=1 Tax=Allocatelliglobosispora scoriae TaxID=643052 RepID=A0A841BPQ1_9ACTN|nr:2'-5' RNA ligase family protein [Allocatelliglobosispora scoriae]MBB5869169.1 hypothetical protein [Allocatelliglobosispora scoriae]
MVAALELYFDHVTQQRIRTLWTALEEVGVQTMKRLLDGRHRPHLSLTGAERLDGPAIAAALDGLAAAPPLEVNLDFCGQFVGRVLWLGPVPTPELLAHHAAVHQRLDAAGISGFDVYRPGAWVPHVTMSMRVPRPLLPQAIRLCLEFLPMKATITGAAVADHAHDEYLPLS